MKEITKTEKIVNNGLHKYKVYGIAGTNKHIKATYMV